MDVKPQEDITLNTGKEESGTCTTHEIFAADGSYDIRVEHQVPRSLREASVSAPSVSADAEDDDENNKANDTSSEGFDPDCNARIPLLEKCENILEQEHDVIDNGLQGEVIRDQFQDEIEGD